MTANFLLMFNWLCEALGVSPILAIVLAALVVGGLIWYFGIREKSLAEIFEDFSRRDVPKKETDRTYREGKHGAHKPSGGPAGYDMQSRIKRGDFD